MRSKQSDDELLLLAQEGVQEAITEILLRYRPLLKSLASRYFVRGADRDDIMQEATIALYRCIENYDLNAESSFAAYAKRSTENAVLDFIRKAEAQKNIFLHESISLEDQYAEALENTSYVDMDNFIEKEQLQAKLEEILSPLEWQVLQGRVLGMTYQEIAVKIGVSKKSVDNAIQRLKQKIAQDIL